MTSATKNLENDHEYILRLIDVMECITETSAPNAEDLESVVDLIRNYADGLHHAKEENMLFPLMAEKGFSPYQGPVAVMLHEHNLGRAYVKGIADNIPGYKEKQQSALALIKENMQGYIDLLRNHIDKENNILFRMADNVLTAGEQQSLLEKFEEEENNSFPGHAPEDFKKRIGDLAKAYQL
jgi:hemerythrin-like domain-containing protein